MCVSNVAGALVESSAETYSEEREVCNMSSIVPIAEDFLTAKNAAALTTVLPMTMCLQVMGHHT